MTALREVQLSKARGEIRASFVGSVSVVSDVHPWKAALPRKVRLDGKLIWAREVQPSKEWPSTRTRVGDKATDVAAVQPAKA